MAQAKKTCVIDKISSNNHDHKCISGNITTSISDHLPQFLIIENLKQTFLRTDVKRSFRNFQNYNETDFQKESDWSLVTKNSDINNEFETFLHIVIQKLDKHVSLSQKSKENI